MKPKGTHNYYVYILTNHKKTVLYTGVTNNLKIRLWQHKNESSKKTFTSRYRVYYLLYYEHFNYINNAIKREKQIKGWARNKKEDLINSFNPSWAFLNEGVS